MYVYSKNYSDSGLIDLYLLYLEYIYCCCICLFDKLMYLLPWMRNVLLHFLPIKFLVFLYLSNGVLFFPIRPLLTKVMTVFNQGGPLIVAVH